MSDKEILEHYANMQKIYGALPDPDHEPKQFAYLVKLYLRHYVNQLS